MSKITQASHQMSISDFGLGADTLLLSLFSGSEYISDLFTFEITVLSENLEIPPDAIVGHYATVKVETTSTRFFHGLIQDFSFGEVVSAHGLREYRLTMVPWFWLLTKTNNYRVFQDKNCAEIVTDIFKQAGFNDFEWNSGGGQTREYCIQHNESDFDFVSRLLEEEGIAYHFVHTESKHTLVFTDQANPFKPCKEFDVEYFPGSKDDLHISKWENHHTLKKGIWSLNDYDFKMPSKNLIKDTTALSPFHSSESLEHYEYPAFYNTTVSDDLIKARIEAEESLKNVSQASSKCVSFYAGGRFKLSSEKAEDQSGEFVIQKIEHLAYDTTYLPKHYLKGKVDSKFLDEASDAQDGNEKKERDYSGSDYANSFHCVPKDVYFRPEQTHKRPVMKGPQSAVVVGPAGEEIYTDEYGRIKVQFIWDREGSHNENSSCFLRVMQIWAGNKWGASFVPRIGHEVIVDFLDGDPDRPIVSGTVYNGNNRPPYTSKTLSGIKSRSTKGASAQNYNEIRMDDKLGSEQLYVHAEKDYDKVVENDRREHVYNDRHKTVENDQFEITKNDHHIITGKNRFEEIQNSSFLSIAHDYVSKIGQNVMSIINGGELHRVFGSRTRQVLGSEGIDIKKSRSVKVGNELFHKGPKMVYQGEDELTIKGPGGFIKIDSSGVTIVGKKVKINEGGSAGVAEAVSASEPSSPDKPRVADPAVDGRS